MMKCAKWVDGLFESKITLWELCQCGYNLFGLKSIRCLFVFGILYVHYMFTICSLYVHYIFTICSFYYHHCMFTLCSLYINYIFTIYSLYVKYIFTVYICFWPFDSKLQWLTLVLGSFLLLNGQKHLISVAEDLTNNKQKENERIYQKRQGTGIIKLSNQYFSTGHNFV